uniref:Uncharacterized protein LOC113784978 n=1 Tax=Cicer arietinum TaxID=3827 RepID=A0A3Q7Y7K2_CICAR|nr:uncharacterized protein LOC113784978 [Cicer arietinum]
MKALERNKTWSLMTLPAGYSDTLALVAKLNTTIVLLSLVANLDWSLHQLDVKIAFLNVYVDDIVLTCDNVAKMDKLKKSLVAEFEIKDLGPLKYFLGMEMEKGDTPVDTRRYQRLVEKLIYLAPTRSDIAFFVSVVSQFMHSPYEEHIEAVYKILRYLKTTPGNGLFFKKTNDKNVAIFTDANWAGSVTDRKSTSEHCTYVWGNLVIWRSKK